MKVIPKGRSKVYSRVLPKMSQGRAGGYPPFWPNAILYAAGPLTVAGDRKDYKAGNDITISQSFCGTFDGVADEITVADGDSLRLGQLPYTDVVMDGHQGGIVTPDYLYVINTTQIDKRERTSPYTLVGSNAAAITGIANVNHLGDGCYHKGKLYIVCERWIDCADNTDHYLMVFNPDTLARESATLLSDQTHEVSSCASDGTYIYITSYCDGTKVWKYSDTGTLVDTIALDQTMEYAQGITILDSEMYIAESARGVTVFDMSGTTARRCIFEGYGDYYEGLDFTDPSLNIVFVLAPVNGIRVLDTRQKYVKGIKISAYVDMTSTVAEQAIASKYKYDTNLRQFYLKVQGGLLDFRVGDGVTTSIATTAITTGLHFVSGEYDSSTGLVYATVDTTTNSAAVNYDYVVFDQPFGIGHLVNTPVTARFVGKMFKVTASATLSTGGSVDTEIPFSEGSGTNVHSDDGTVVGAITATGIAAFWAGRQDTYHRNVTAGWWESSTPDGIFYPSDPGGGTFHPGGKWNGAESSYSMPEVAALITWDTNVVGGFWFTAGSANAKTEAEIVTHVDGSAVEFFSQLRGYCGYDAALTGASLTTVQNYFGVDTGVAITFGADPITFGTDPLTF